MDIINISTGYAKPINNSSAQSKFPYIEHIGIYTELPTPYEKTTLDSFINIFTAYSPLALDTRQIHLADRTTKTYKIYFFHREAFAVSWNKGNLNKSIVYRIGCNHDTKTQKQIGLYKKLKCVKCGLEFEEDSSG